MSINDPIGDFLVRIKNGQQARKRTITAPNSTVKEAIAAVLKEEGYIADFKTTTEGVKKTITVTLKYFQGKPVIERLERISKPSLRQYRSKGAVPKILGGLGVAILTTPQGVLSDKQARKAGVGGELICVVA
ncbi:MAG TPA: 30S ribosomal protein S8 [Candidatus Binatia bacterium]|nr:30S ribosomal protein S8 [Candidatus Binatia bacterium]